MRSDKRAVVFFGPDAAFEEFLRDEIGKGEQTADYLESVRIYNARVRASDFCSQEAKDVVKSEVDNCIVRTNDYGSVLSHVVANFSSVLEGAFEFQTAYVQNPPKRVLSSLIAAYGEDSVDVIRYRYKVLGKHDLPNVHAALSERVLGQEACKESLMTNLYRLAVMTDGSPSVILFYGPSGVGKTEAAKAVSDAFDGKMTRIQFSMMQTNEAYEYLFGAEHSKASFARDLLCRESNVVLIDEFDKVQTGLYNMFYQLFDEGRYVDTNYDLDMSGTLIILTSNFSSEFEAKRAVGPAVFSRIDACVRFDDLKIEQKALIARRHYDFVMGELDQEDRAIIEASDIADWFESNACRYDNMRILKNKVEKAIFEKLSKTILGS